MSFISTYNTVSVASTATLIMASNLERKGCLIVNNGSATLYLGMDSSVTTSNGLPIAAGSTFNNSSLYAAWRGSIYGIVTTGTVDARFWEYGV